MRPRSLSRFLPLLLAGCAVAALTACSGQPENSPAIRKKFAEFDQVQKSVDRLSGDIQTLTDSVRKLSEENSDLRALAPDASGLTQIDKTIERLAAIEARLSKMDETGGVIAVKSKSPDSTPVVPTSSTKPAVDLASAELAAPAVKDAAPAPAAVEAVKEAPKKETKKAVEKKKTETKAVAKKAPVSRGSYYTVKSGETIESLAASRKLAVDDILKANRMTKGARVAPGAKLFLPAGK